MQILTCQFCGGAVSIDIGPGDDVIRPAKLTPGGDLACDVCFRAIDDDEREQDEECGDYFPYPFDDE